MGPTLNRLISSALLLLLWPTVVVAYAQCYYPDGSEAKDYTFVECYTPSTEPDALSRHAPCCIPSEGDICQSYGLCYWPGGKTLYRGACTDPTWQDPACQSISVCADSKPQNATWIYVQKCEGGEWQCGALDGMKHSLAGCDKKDEEFEDMIRTKTTTMAAPTTFSRPSTVTSSNGASETDTEITETSATTAPSTNSTGGLSKGAIAGIAIGAWAAFTFIGSLAWWCGRRGKGQASSAPPAHTNAWDDDPWTQNISGFGQPFGRMGMVHYGSAPSYVADGDGGTYAANSGFGAAANNPPKSEGTHEAVHEIGSEIGGNTLVPIGLAMAAQNGEAAGSGSSPYASPVNAIGSPLPRYQSPPAELPSEQRDVADMDGRATATR